MHRGDEQSPGEREDSRLAGALLLLLGFGDCRSTIHAHAGTAAIHPEVTDLGPAHGYGTRFRRVLRIWTHDRTLDFTVIAQQLGRTVI
jgi:hypothetical protein